MACRLCPKKIEGTMYALLMSTLNFGGMLAHQGGGLLMYFLGITENNFQNLWILILIANCTILLPLPMLLYLDFNFLKIESNQDRNEADKTNEVRII